MQKELCEEGVGKTWDGVQKQLLSQLWAMAALWSPDPYLVVTRAR